MENQLIQLYLLVCLLYDTQAVTCFQRLSNNSKPKFTDQEVMTIYLFGHLQGRFEKKAIDDLIVQYWRPFFPLLPAYQTFCARLNLLTPGFQTLGGIWQAQVNQARLPEGDHLVDSLPIMLAKGGHAYSARVARDFAEVGYCPSRKTDFHGARLHTVGQRRSGRLPRPTQIWLREGSCHDLPSIKDQELSLSESTLIGDKAYCDAPLQQSLAEQGTTLYTPIKKPKGQELTRIEKYYNRLVSRLRQPIESFFNWLINKTNIQNAGTVRSTEGLMLHCFGKLTFAFYLLVFNS